MKLRRPRSCEGCPASKHLVCELGYAADEVVYMERGGRLNFMSPPKTGCPRPYSIKEMIELKNKD